MLDKMPKILFIGAVTFENTTGSHLFFYRLFKNYPPDKLMVIGSHKSRNAAFSSATLPKVSYHMVEETVDFQYFRLKGDRIPTIRKINKHLYLEQLYRDYYNRIKKTIKAFQPDIILSLTMNYHWYFAFRISKKLNIPLDLVLHDRWESNVRSSLYTNIGLLLTTKFKTVFQYARNRFCISPTMEQIYFAKFGIRSDVAYPIGKESLPESAVLDKQKFKNVVYFGNIWGQQSCFIQLAHLLDKRGMRLVLFSNKNINFFKKAGLKSSNVIAHPFQKQADLIAWCKANAAIFYLPMYFEEDKKEMVQHSFPSKLVDYTYFGRPLIIYAPEVSSLVRFAEQHRDTPFAEVVSKHRDEALEQALTNLEDDEYRKRLGENSLKIWNKFFSPMIVRKSFFDKMPEINPSL